MIVTGEKGHRRGIARGGSRPTFPDRADKFSLRSLGRISNGPASFSISQIDLPVGRPGPASSWARLGTAPGRDARAVTFSGVNRLAWRRGEQ